MTTALLERPTIDAFDLDDFRAITKLSPRHRAVFRAGGVRGGVANQNPIYTLTPDIQWGSQDGNGGTAGPLKTANTAKDGTGTVLTVFTADATNGGFVRAIRARAAGTNVASVLRVFINNGSTNATIANNVLYDEMSLPATTLTEVAATQLYELPLNFALPAGFKINVTLGTTVSAGYVVSVVGGKY